jgi:hypothetical protein
MAEVLVDGSRRDDIALLLTRLISPYGNEAVDVPW